MPTVAVILMSVTGGAVIGAVAAVFMLFNTKDGR